MSTEEQSKKDLYYMQRALTEAEAAYKEGEIPVGAVVVCRDRIIARAHNLTAGDSLQPHPLPIYPVRYDMPCVFLSLFAEDKRIKGY